MSARARTLAVLAAGHALNAMAGGFVFPFFAIYIRGQGHGAAWVGTCFALITLLSAFGRVGGGELADRRGRRPVVLLAVAVRSFLLLAMGVAAHVEAPLLLVTLPVVLASVARGAYEPAADAIIADLVPPPERPRAYAHMRIARNAGWALGPALGGFVGAERFGLLCMAAAALGFLKLALSRSLAESPHTGAAARFHPRDLLLALRDRRFRTHCILTAGLFVLFAQLLVSVSMDLAARVGLSSIEIGWAYTLNGVMVVALQAVTTRVVERWRPQHMLGAGALLDGAGYLLVGLANDLPLALAGIAVVTLGEMITLPLSAAVAADIAPPDRRGRYLGAYGVFMDVGHGLGQAMGGLGLAAAGADPLRFWWAVVAFSALVAAGYFRPSWRRRG
jgi:MFS family permease